MGSIRVARWAGTLLAYPSGEAFVSRRIVSLRMAGWRDLRRLRMPDHRSPAASIRLAIFLSVNVRGATSPLINLIPGARRRYGSAGLGSDGIRRGVTSRSSRCGRCRPESAPPRSALWNSCVRFFGSRLTSSVPAACRESRDLSHARPCRRAARRCGIPSSRRSSPSSAARAPASRSRTASAAARSMRRIVNGRIEIEDTDVRVVQVRRARGPDMRRDAVLIDEPQQRSRVGDERMVHGAVFLRNLDPLQPIRKTLRHVLLNEALLADAGRETLHRHRALQMCGSISGAIIS